MTLGYKWLLILAGVVVLSTTVHAQDDDEPPMSRERMQQRMEDVRKMKLIDILQLQDTQVEKFFQIYNTTHGNVLRLQREMQDAAENVKRMSRENAAGLQQQIDVLQKTTHDLHQAIEQRNTRVKDVLNLQQYGTYLAFEAKFHEELARLLIKRAKEQGPRGGRRNRD
ncbi:MAG: hypothetical protein ACK5BQ_09045 [Ignavibacteria bacterium]|jgi:thioesterase domain-containing protein